MFERVVQQIEEDLLEPFRVNNSLNVFEGSLELDPTLGGAFVKGDIFYSTTNGVSFDLREAFADIAVQNTVFVRAGK